MLKLFKFKDSANEKRVLTYYSANFSCSLYKLRLKFVQTTRVVCTDFAEVLSLGRVLYVFRLGIWKLSYAEIKKELHGVCCDLSRPCNSS